MKKLLLTAAFVLVTSTAYGQSLGLSWQDNSNNEDGFNIERAAVPSGPFVRIAQVGANVTTYVDSGLLGGTQYCYRVNAFNAVGESGFSNTACATTLSRPDDPSGLELTLGIE